MHHLLSHFICLMAFVFEIVCVCARHHIKNTSQLKNEFISARDFLPLSLRELRLFFMCISMSFSLISMNFQLFFFSKAKEQNPDAMKKTMVSI